jgi:hypothetical protein
MMNEQESIHAFDRLTKILNENGLGWVTEQVNEQIRNGKTIQREIETLKEGKEMPLFATFDDYPRKLTRGPKATFPVTVEYQPSERLELLIDAIRQSIVDTADMEHNLVSFTEKADETPKKFLFYSDEPNSEPILISAETIRLRHINSKRLNELLTSLQREISK